MKHLLLRKTDVFKTCRKSKFLKKRISRNALALKSKKVQGIFGETFILALLSSTVFRLENRVSDFFCFAQEINGFYQSSLGNEFEFFGIYLKKLKHAFVDKRALITATSRSSCY